MDIQINREIYEGLVKHNKDIAKNYGNMVLEGAPANKKYPFTVFQTIRDVSERTSSCYGKISSKGYRVHIYAQDKGKVSRFVIAETIAKQINEFLEVSVGLRRESYNTFDLENEGTTLHIVMIYSGNLDEYRRKFF